MIGRHLCFKDKRDPVCLWDLIIWVDRKRLDPITDDKPMFLGIATDLKMQEELLNREGQIPIKLVMGVAHPLECFLCGINSLREMVSAAAHLE